MDIFDVFFKRLREVSKTATHLIFATKPKSFLILKI